MKRYILFAGVNGAGKSTLYRIVDQDIRNLPRVNVDEILKTFGDWRNFGDILKAGKIAIAKIESNFSEGLSFNQETTLCGASIMKNILRAKSLGYYIEVHYVGVASAEVAKERIKMRVAMGGHGIPDADVDRRYVESFRKLKEIMPLCDELTLYDNTTKLNWVATYKDNKLVWKNRDALPDWYRKLQSQ